MKIKLSAIHCNFRWILGFALSMILINLCTAGEFAPDANTLLLAHFNEAPYQADYANGYDRFTGSGAQLTEGYYGKGINLSGQQFIRDFMTKGEAGSPRAFFEGFSFSCYGNVNLDQGTYECWFKLPPPGETTYRGTSLAGTYIHRQVTKPGDKYSRSLNIDLNAGTISFCLPYLPYDYETGEVRFKKVAGFERSLDPKDWHHFALCWSRGELAMYLDGRSLYAADLSKYKGFAFMGRAGEIHLNGLIADELRISDVVRYAKDFEPAWRDGQRPAYAFSGVPNLKRYPPQLEPPCHAAALNAEKGGPAEKMTLGGTTFIFDRQKGHLLGIGFQGEAQADGINGFQLWQGLEHALVSPAEATHWRMDPKGIQFTQRFPNEVTAYHHLTEKDGVINWQVTLENHGSKEAWLEPLMSLPLPAEEISEYFDGSAIQRKLTLPRRRTEYASTMPFAAAAGKTATVGVGLDPHEAYNMLISEWIPGEKDGAIRQGLRVALSPGEQYACTWFLFRERADFGVLNALERYHDLSPDLYQLRPDVPIYSYMPTSVELPIEDYLRLAYVGGIWGHGPGHTKGDEFGNPRWWDLSKYYADFSYEHAMKLERMWDNLANMRNIIQALPQKWFENSYTMRRSHYAPDCTPDFIVKELWPEYKPEGDPLLMDQYYLTVNGNWFVNEYRTPLGMYFRELTRRNNRQKTPYSPGYINDVSATGNMRHADPIAKKSPGRAFCRDKGTYVLGHCGRVERYRTINSFVDDGHRMSIWSDGGTANYLICAYSAACASEQYSYAITGAKASRGTTAYMLGEKATMASKGIRFSATPLVEQFDPADFTPETLRDYARYCDAHALLFALKHKIAFQPLDLFGRQEMMENWPVFIESLTLGRRTHPGGYVDEPLWMVRSGRGETSLLAIGNETPREGVSAVRLLNPYFEGVPVFGAYFGGETVSRLDGSQTILENVKVPPRGISAFKCLGLFAGEVKGTVKTSFTGDGLTYRIRLDYQVDRETDLKLNLFEPMYALATCKLNGKNTGLSPDRVITLEKGTGTLEVTGHNCVFDFEAGDWERFNLLKDGKANFCLVTDPGYERVYGQVRKRPYPQGFERGTAMMLNQFLEQYDDEDGVHGNLEAAPLVKEKPKDFTGWTVILKEDFPAGDGRVRIDTGKREVIVTGRTQGQMRRAMVVFLRLLDRKYPHVGTLLPIWKTEKKGDKTIKVPTDDPVEAWGNYPKTKEFFTKFADKDFLKKPLLKPAYEKLYAGNNRDFAGKYTLQWSPCIFEPTYTDDFVYGYEGAGTVETPEELNRGFRPEREAFEKKKEAEQRKKEAEAAEKTKKKQ